jgi:UMP-CMP kinase 2, mitochondrial
MNQFIVIEGLDATGKSTLVDNLSKALSAVKLSCPPEIIIPSIQKSPSRSHFDSLEPIQRRAYYRFSNLVASEEASKNLAHSYVVMDRYWTSTAAFAAMDEGFEHDVEIGNYPEEIRKPDLVILLIVDEENRLKRLNGRGEGETKEESELATNKIKRENVLAAYKKFNPVIVDTSGKTPVQVCIEALEIIKELR